MEGVAKSAHARERYIQNCDCDTSWKTSTKRSRSRRKNNIKMDVWKIGSDASGVGRVWPSLSAVSELSVLVQEHHFSFRK
jgi:hypothetical protein